MGTNRRKVIAGMISLMFFGMQWIVGQGQPKPNIIFFYIDDLGWTDLGVYGSEFYETPAIDELAKEGFRFTSAYQSARCVPSRTSLFTGKYHERSEVADSKGLALSEYTFAEAFQDAGYHTFFTGKWHLGKEASRYPDQQGFDVNKAGCEWGAPKGNDAGGGYYYSPYSCPTLSDGPEGEYLTDRLTDETIKFLEDHRNTRPGDPFLACVFHYAVHTPIEAPDSYVEPYLEKLPEMDYERPVKEIDGPAKTNLRHDHPVYAGMIASVDESVRRIREKLDQLGLASNTIIIFSSDHGGLSTTLKSNGREIATSNFPLRTGKGWLYEGGIRSPLIVHWPGVISPGTTSDEMVVNMDIYPSLLEMAGLPMQQEQHLDGESFTPLLRGEEWSRSEPIMWYFPFAKTGTGNPSMAALRNGNYKLIHFQHQDRYELYNLASDIGEKHDLSDARPDLLETMKQQLREMETSSNMPPLSANRITLEQEEIIPEYTISIPQEAYPELRIVDSKFDKTRNVFCITFSISETNEFVHPVDLFFDFREAGSSIWVPRSPDKGICRHLIPGTYTVEFNTSSGSSVNADVKVTGRIQNALYPESIGEFILPGEQIKKKKPVDLGFFNDYWSPKTASVPDFENASIPRQLPEVAISVDVSDTLARISPYVGGYNLNTYFGGKIYDKPELMRHISNLDLPFFRYPGGSGSLWYFWNHARPNLPDSVDYLNIKGETFHISEKIRWGDKPGDDYLSLDNSYTLRNNLGTEAIHVVNYALARYGRHKNPVAAAAGYAADWVRYDNGRTKFWELGNEIYGSWEPSWIIDTARNLDGQPRQITGTLYAEHCLVFLDSMRAAAAEIGTDIKIGATLGFQENREQWDREVLQVLGDQVDFYIVHKYFGNHQDALPVELFGSIDEFYQHKAHIDELMELYCPNPVPLVLTEWNTRYSGSQQNVSCANGMHTIQGMKGIINEGIGLSCKWNLIWGYQGGDTHGLISGEKDNPAIEGIPAYFPRAPFMYQYYFKKFLGDISVGNQYNASENLDVFSSHYSSGQTSVIVLNKSAEQKNVVLNLENFEPGSLFYSYSLTPSNGNLYDRKVNVNGIANGEYDAGGPIQYENIKAIGRPTAEGVRLQLKPYAATYLLIDGNMEVRPTESAVTFRIFSRNKESVTVLENAIVRIDNNYYITNSQGEVTILTGNDAIDYTLLANGHDTLQTYVDVTNNMLVQDTLDYATYDVSIAFVDENSGDPIVDAEISLDDQVLLLKADGTVDFTDVNYGSYQVGIYSKAYKESLPIEIFSDTTLQITLSKTEYLVNFLIINHIDGESIANATLSFNGDDFFSDLEGYAECTAVYGTYNLTVEAQNYRLFNATFELSSDTSITIEMELAAANIKFKVYDSGTPVNNASIDLNGDVKNTNAIGIVNYYAMETGISYAYTITHSSLGTMKGDIILVNDTTVVLDYKGKQNEIIIQIIDSYTSEPVGESQVLLNESFRQADGSGWVTYQFPSGDYILMIDKDRYADYTAILEIRSDTMIQVSIDLVSAVIKFNIQHEGTLVQGAQIDLNGESNTTNSLGNAVFSNVTVGQSYEYTIQHDDYNAFEGSLEVRHDSTLTINLIPLTFSSAYSNKLKVYPNPASNFLFIEPEFEAVRIHLIDMKGRINEIPVLREHIRYAISLEGVAPGLYLLQILGTADEHVTKRFHVIPAQ